MPKSKRAAASDASRSKLSDALQREVLQRVAANETLPSICTWLRSKHRVRITKQALSKLVAKHRAPPRTLPSMAFAPVKALTFDAHRRRLNRLLALVTKDALEEASMTNVDKVVKMTRAWWRLEEAHRLANKPVDESVSDLASLLAKA